MMHMYAVGWPWPAARGPTSHPLTPLPHQDRQGEKIWWKSLKVEIKRGRLLTSYCHKQYRLDLGKISLIYCQWKNLWLFFWETKTSIEPCLFPTPFPRLHSFVPNFSTRERGLWWVYNCSSPLLLPPHGFSLLHHRPLHGLQACALPWSPSFSSSFSDFVLCPVVSVFSPFLCLFSVFALS